MSNDIMISRHRHQGPICGMLERYGIGQPDRYGRGIWLSEADLPKIIARMKSDPTRIEAGGRLFVKGSEKGNNHVEMYEIQRLFGKG